MCLICDRIAMIRRGENPYFVRELQTGYVVLGDHQHFRGYALLLHKTHEPAELYELDPAEKALFLTEMTRVAEAVARAFHAEKMNYELLGMGDAHLHWHLYPRRTGDMGDRNGPVWLYPGLNDDDNRPTAAELDDMKRRLNAELDRLA